MPVGIRFPDPERRLICEEKAWDADWDAGAQKESDVVSAGATDRVSVLRATVSVRNAATRLLIRPEFPACSSGAQAVGVRFCGKAQIIIGKLLMRELPGKKTNEDSMTAVWWCVVVEAGWRRGFAASEDGGFPERY